MGGNTASGKAKEGRVAEKKDKQIGDPSFNMDELQALAALVNEHGFTDFEFENENIRVRLSKMAGTPAAHAAPPVVSSPAVPPPGTAPEAPPAEAADADAELHKITSPIVGTFYRAAGPDKDPYVTEGSRVSPESTVCIVEAMKLMNEIQAEVAGEIVKVYVENGQPVEYGQALFGVRK